MALTFVLRLAETNPPGQIVGRVEAVASGEIEVIRGVDDLAAFIHGCAERVRAQRSDVTTTHHPNTENQS